MRSHVSSAALAAAFVLAPVAAGFAPAWSQDFSITNTAPGPGTEWMKGLQAWWDVHAYYPPDAAEHNLSGNVKLHLVIHQDGQVWSTQLEEGSGSRILDVAGADVFHSARLRPVGTAAPQSDVYVTVHFVLTHRHE